MEIVLLVVLFLVGTIGGAIQALRYLDRKQKPHSRPESSTDDSTK